MWNPYKQKLQTIEVLKSILVNIHNRAKNNNNSDNVWARGIGLARRGPFIVTHNVFKSRGFATVMPQTMIKIPHQYKDWTLNIDPNMVYSLYEPHIAKTIQGLNENI